MGTLGVGHGLGKVRKMRVLQDEGTLRTPRFWDKSKGCNGFGYMGVGRPWIARNCYFLTWECFWILAQGSRPSPKCRIHVETKSGQNGLRKYPTLLLHQKQLILSCLEPPKSHIGQK